MSRNRLVAGLIAGEQQAWFEFVREYGHIVYAVAGRLGFDGSARDDLFQETCLMAFRKIGDLKQPDRLASWIYTIAYRLAVESLRRKRPRLQSFDDAPLADFETSIDPAFVIELEQLDQAARLRDILEKLDQRCRSLLTALYLAEPRLSYQEVSVRYEIPVGSIGPNRARCLEKTKKLLKDQSNDSQPPSAL